MLTLRLAETPEDLQTVRILFQEYQASLDLDLGFQGFPSEVQGLPGPYAPPGGRLLLARWNGEPVGCIALRPFEGAHCEMKRLYVRPSGRGLGVGRALVARILEEARAIGYAEVLLDTLPTMAEAQGLYLAFGFRDIPPYRPNPVPGARFMGRPLAVP